MPHSLKYVQQLTKQKQTIQNMLSSDKPNQPILHFPISSWADNPISYFNQSSKVRSKKRIKTFKTLTSSSNNCIETVGDLNYQEFAFQNEQKKQGDPIVNTQPNIFNQIFNQVKQNYKVILKNKNHAQKQFNQTAKATIYSRKSLNRKSPKSIEVEQHQLSNDLRKTFMVQKIIVSDKIPIFKNKKLASNVPRKSKFLHRSEFDIYFKNLKKKIEVKVKCNTKAQEKRRSMSHFNEDNTNKQKEKFTPIGEAIQNDHSDEMPFEEDLEESHYLRSYYHRKFDTFKKNSKIIGHERNPNNASSSYRTNPYEQNVRSHYQHILTEDSIEDCFQFKKIHRRRKSDQKSSPNRKSNTEAVHQPATHQEISILFKDKKQEKMKSTILQRVNLKRISLSIQQERNRLVRLKNQSKKIQNFMLNGIKISSEHKFEAPVE